MSSILTDTSALVALQTLKSSSAGLAKAQNEISTGMKVATAKDNSSSWAIAATMGSDVASYKKLGESLTSASAMVGTARTASEQISGILKQIQVKVVQADGADTDSLAKLQADVDALTVDETDKAAYPALAHAVLENQRVWGTLSEDLMLEANALPVALRAQLISLAEFVRRHSLAVLGGRARLAPLIDINTAIMKGLRGEVETAA